MSRGGLLAFECADNHIHAALAIDRASAGDFARYVQCALVWRLGLDGRFEPARVRPLHDQRHAYNTFRYVHRQQERHQLVLDPFREGSSLPDLLGLRVLSTSIIARVREHLPRVHRGELLAQWPGVVLDANENANANAKRPLNADVLADAAAAAFALPHLGGRSTDAIRAKRAAIHAAGSAMTSRVLSELLGLSMRAVQELRAQVVEVQAVRAVVLQARLRDVR